MSPEEYYEQKYRDDYYSDYEEEQMKINWQQFEDEQMNKQEAKVVDFSIVYHDPKVKAIIIENGHE